MPVPNPDILLKLKLESWLNLIAVIQIRGLGQIPDQMRAQGWTEGNFWAALQEMQRQLESLVPSDMEILPSITPESKFRLEKDHEVCKICNFGFNVGDSAVRETHKKDAKMFHFGCWLRKES